MFQKIFGGFFGGSSAEGHTSSSEHHNYHHHDKDDTATNASVTSVGSSTHGTSASSQTGTHLHKHHKHLRTQRGIKPYHNSQNPDRKQHQDGFEGPSDNVSTVSFSSTHESQRGMTGGGVGAPTAATRGMSRKSSTTAFDNTAATSSAGLSRPVQTDVYQKDEAPFLAAMSRDTADLSALRTLSWHGCPVSLRSDVWMLLSGHWNPVKSLRENVVARKRQEYTSYVQGNYDLVDWDAVCALADRGKDGASVRRSALLSQHPQRNRAGRPSLPARVQASGGDAGGAPAAAVHGQPSAEDSLTSGLGRPRPSYSSLDLLALEESHRKGRSADSGVGAPPRATQTRPPSLDGEENDAQGAAGALEGTQLLLPDTSIASAPAALTNGGPGVTEDVLAASASALRGQLSGSVQDSSWPTTPPPSAVTGDPVRRSPSSSITSLPARPQTADPFSFPTFSSPSARTSPPLLPTRRLTTTPRVSLSTMVSSKEMQMLKQIRKDVPRMSGGMAYLQHPRVQGMIERMLFTWSLRHPACGYVQGMNDLLLPFVNVNLARRFCATFSIAELRAYSAETVDTLLCEAAVPADEWVGVLEADIYWCASYFLNGMQDNYTQNQTGIYHMCERLRQVISAADPKLYAHLVTTLQLSFVQFTFRWMNCMLMRELTALQQLRLLDAYLSDQDRRWTVTHVYVCAALLLRWSKQLLQMTQFVDAATFLQSPPTNTMTPREMDDVLSEAFLLENLYDAGLQHLQTSQKT